MKLDMGKKGTSSIIILFSIIVLSFLVIQISEFVKKVQADVDKLQIGTTSQSAQTFVGTPELQAGMHITGGNVGIGTTGPGALLEVSKTDATLGSKTLVAIVGRDGAIASGAERAAAIAFKDANNPTFTAGIAGIRQIPDTDFNGSLAFYVSNTGGSAATAFTDLTEDMRITNTGNVGIGTTGPGAKLDVKGSKDAVKIDSNSNAAKIEFYPWYADSTENVAQIGYIANAGGAGAHKALQFYTLSGGSSVEALRINRYGNVGIGNTNPTYKLDVAGTGRFTSTVTAPTFSGNATTATTATYLTSGPDYAITASTPQSSFSRVLRHDFTNTGPGTYRTLLTIAGYSRGASQIAFPYGAYNNELYWRRGNYSTDIWDSWRKIITESSSGGTVYIPGAVGVGIAPNASYKLYTSGGTYGIWASGTTMGGRFVDTNGTSTTYAAWGSWGIYTGQGAYYGGNVGIKDTSPDYTLDIVGSLYVGGSSRRYKENIKDIEIDSEKIYKLRSVSFDFKEEHKDKGVFLGKGRQIGLIAEEVYDVIPELAIREEGGGLISDTDYEKLAVVMLPEVQKHEKKINLLSEIVNTVTKTINATLVETKKLIVDGVDILKKLNELSDKVEKQQIEINALKEKVNKLEQVKVN